ncbi:MAG: hypothetical protein ACR2NA_11560, partial [Solirubrobacterales bacterium]
MSRKPTPLTAAERAELDAVDRALRGDALAPEHRALGELATAVRAARPPLPPELSRRLDAEQAERRTARETGLAGRLSAATRRLRSHRGLMPLMGGAGS